MLVLWLLHMKEVPQDPKGLIPAVHLMAQDQMSGDDGQRAALPSPTHEQEIKLKMDYVRPVVASSASFSRLSQVALLQRPFPFMAS
jgi:hypothetical protein